MRIEAVGGLGADAPKIGVADRDFGERDLAAHAEFVPLLEERGQIVGGDAADHDVGLGGADLEDERGIVGGVDGHFVRADHLAAIGRGCSR